jgi:hypothetical protein
VKALILIVLLAVVCVVLFIAGVISPRRSRRMQEGVDRLSRWGEDKGDRRAGRFGDVSRKSLKKMRGGADASARKGREVHDRFTG